MCLANQLHLITFSFGHTHVRILTLSTLKAKAPGIVSTSCTTMITEDYLSVIFCFSNTLNTRVSEERIHKSEWNVSVTAPETESKCLEGKITWERNETLLIDINMTLQEEHACSGNDWQTEGAFSAGTACILLQIMYAPNKSKLILKSKTLSCAFTNNQFTLPLLFSPFATFCSLAKSEWVMFCADTLTCYSSLYEHLLRITGYYWIWLHGYLFWLVSRGFLQWNIVV